MMNSVQTSAKAAGRSATAQKTDDRITNWHVRASQNDAAARAYVLEYYARPENVETAIGDCEIAAASGNVNAMIRLGCLYISGIVIRHDEDKAYDFFMQALFSPKAKRAQREDIKVVMTSLLGRPFRFNIGEGKAWFVNSDKSKSYLALMPR